MKKFDLQAAKSGAPIVTRDGREAKFIAHVPEIDEDKRLLILINGDSHLTSYHETGVGPSFFKGWDLFMKPQKRTVWVNIYKEQHAITAVGPAISSRVYAREIDAKHAGTSEYCLAMAIAVEIEE